jgi:tetratricopeptide (TPR) repeat protein
LLAFDRDAERWTWDVAQIRARGFTDNIVDLMVGKLTRLPVATQDAMKHFACLGNRVAIETLSMVQGMSDVEIAAVLRDPLHMGLIFRSEGGFVFLHDRVKEAAYALLSPSDRAATHLRIGRLLAAHTPADKIGECIFDIVNQLNRGAAFITSTEERDRVAELNLIAGKRAQAAAAFASALTYFANGDAMLNEDSWDRRYPLAFELALRRGETEFLTGHSDSAEARLAGLARCAADLVDRAAVTCVRLDLYMTLGRSDRAVETGLEYLRHFGVAWSAHPTEEEVRQEYDRMWRQLGRRPIEELINAPAMTDPKWRAIMDVLTKIMPPALFTDKNLQCLVLGRMANLSLEHGNCDGSCLGYVWLGGVLGPHFGDYRAGYRFGKLSVDLVEQRGLNRFMARVLLGFGSLVIPWTRHVHTGIPVMRRALATAQETGDLTYAAFVSYDMISQRLASGDPLEEVQRETESALEVVLKSRFGLIADSITGQLNLIRTLRGLTPKFGLFSDGVFDEVHFERHLESDPHLANATCRYWIRKLQARFYANDSTSPVEAVGKASRLLWALPPSIEAADYHFHAALALAGNFFAALKGEQAQQLETIAAHHMQLTVWARNCPENFAAEIARIQGQDLDAMRYYEDAIKLAREHGFVQNEGVACELAAKFYAGRGFTTIAQTYFRCARSCYQRWGRWGKCSNSISNIVACERKGFTLRSHQRFPRSEA